MMSPENVENPLQRRDITSELVALTRCEHVQCKSQDDRRRDERDGFRGVEHFTSLQGGKDIYVVDATRGARYPERN